MNEVSPRGRRWFRFSLRSLLVLITVGAASSFVYWTGWPWWLACYDQMRFETAVRSIRAGMTPDETEAFIKHEISQFSVIVPSGMENDHVLLTRYTLERGVYFLLFKTKRGDSPYANECPVTSVEGFRFPQLPTDYQPRTEQAQRDLASWQQPLSTAERSETAFWLDAMVILTGDRSNSYGLEFERFYSAGVD
jgi:hypothetical protein